MIFCHKTRTSQSHRRALVAREGERNWQGSNRAKNRLSSARNGRPKSCHNCKRRTCHSTHESAAESGGIRKGMILKEKRAWNKCKTWALNWAGGELAIDKSSSHAIDTRIPHRGEQTTRIEPRGSQKKAQKKIKNRILNRPREGRSRCEA